MCIQTGNKVLQDHRHCVMVGIVVFAGYCLPGHECCKIRIRHEITCHLGHLTFVQRRFRRVKNKSPRRARQAKPEERKGHLGWWHQKRRPHAYKEEHDRRNESGRMDGTSKLNKTKSHWSLQDIQECSRLLCLSRLLVELHTIQETRGAPGYSLFSHLFTFERTLSLFALAMKCWPSNGGV